MDNGNSAAKNQTTFWDHLSELRTRLTWCAWVFFLGFVAFYFLSDFLLDFLKKPLFDVLPPEKRFLYYTGLFENFLVHLKIAGYAALVFLSPIYFCILWGFVKPGLKENEIKNLVPFTCAAAMFFLIGAGFAYFLLLPTGIRFFLHYGTSSEVAWLTLDNYVSLILKLLFGFGVCFELPVLIILIAKLGFITQSNLKNHRRTAVIAITITSAFVAPPDAISMLMLMAPLYLLYEGAIFVVGRLEKRVVST